jgi:predicted nucleic acid-binding protein
MARRPGIGGSVVLDAQGIVKLAAGDPVVRGHLREALSRDQEVVTAASILAEVLRGGLKDGLVRQALQHVIIVPVDSALGRKAGELLGAAGLSGENWASSLLAAVALAQPRPVMLLTSDPGDMTRLTEEPGREKADRVAIVAI